MTKTVELLAVNAKDETEALPAQNGPEDVIEVWEIEVIRHCHDSDDHRIHMMQNCS